MVHHLSCGRLGGFPNNSDNNWILSIHEHEAATEQCLLAEVVKFVWAQGCDQDFTCGQSAQMILINLSPMLHHVISQYHIGGGMVVSDQNIAVVHLLGLHVRVKMKNFFKDFLRFKFRLLVRKTILQYDARSISEYRKIPSPIRVVTHPVNDLI